MGDTRAAAGNCASCGAPDDRLQPVRRVYLDVDELGGARELATLDDVEWWCPACRVTYPHKPASGGPGRAAQPTNSAPEDTGTDAGPGRAG